MIEGENVSSDFTPAEQAFIQSGGEAELPETIETVTPEADEPEAAEVTEQKPAEEKKAEKFVPHGAFHEEREKRKARERELQGEREARIRLEERIKAFETQNKPAEQAVPNVEEDPVGYFKHETQQLNEKLGKFEQTTQQRLQAEQQIQYEQSVVGAYRASVSEIQAEAPDFKDAYQYLVTSRIDELKAAGMSPEEAMAEANQNEFYLVERALKERRNPAQAIYSMAKARGFQPKKTENGAEKLDRIAAGQAEGKSLGSASGSGANETGIEAMLNMNEDDFTAAVKRGDFKKLAGG